MADEQLKFVVGADTSQFNAELQKAENELKQFQAALKRTTDVNALEVLNGKIIKTQQTIAGLNNSFKSVVPSANKATQSITDLSRIVQDAPFGFIGIANNINPLVESFGRLKSESGSVGGALKSLIGGLSGPGGLGLAFAAVTTAITFAQIGFQAWTRTSQKTKETLDETAKALSSIQSSVASEASNVAGLVAILENETETRKRKLSAIKELQKINPEIFNQLRLEGDQVVGLTTSYKAYIESLKNVVIDGVTLTGLTAPIAVVDGGTGATTAATARSNLGAAVWLPVTRKNMQRD